MRSKKPLSAGKPALVIFIALLLVLAVAVQPAQARKFKVLHTFKGSDGANPISQLLRDSAGNLYGVTILGGTGKCQGGCGTAFKMDNSGELIWQHNFNGANGFEPVAGLLRDSAGNFYGTTVFGGIVNNHVCSLGCGVVFKLNRGGKETVLHKFTGPDGYFPQAPLVARPTEHDDMDNGYMEEGKEITSSQLHQLHPIQPWQPANDRRTIPAWRRQ